jgi:crotonobetainyl-CoA:carnitine CoA-transferase CaiB-like acyl-CoA transferase
VSEVLAGLRVVDLSSTIGGAVTTMLLADYGAEVVRVEPPSGDPVRAFPAWVVWQRGKQRVAIDPTTASGAADLAALVGGADVVVDDGATTPLLGDHEALPGDHDRLVRCSITGYGSRGPLADRPAIDLLVQARTAVQYEQPARRGGRSGPIFYASPLPSYGAAILANIGIAAALLHRERSGRGQRVETSLLQGVLAWTANTWQRVEKPTPRYFTYRPGADARDIMPTPTYEAGDHLWFHPMPEILGAVLEELELTMRDVPGMRGGQAEAVRAHQAAVQSLLMQRTRQEWLELFWRKDLRAQPVLSVEEGFEHEQIVTNEVVVDVDVPGVGTTRQFAFPHRYVGKDRLAPGGPAASPEPTAAWTGERPSAAAPAAGTSVPVGDGPLAGLRVLDFGLALAGPFGPMRMADLGADVIRVENARGRRAAGARASGDGGNATTISPAEALASATNQVWSACQRGKRSISIDLKSPEGIEIARRLIATADVIHHNMRPGVAERIGIGYEDAKKLNPGIVYAHVTGFGTRGPLVQFPGCDQMGQALTGFEHEQGATPAGGTPTWHRLGLTDHATALASVIGATQALYLREKTGEPALIEADILSTTTFLLSHMYLPEDGPAGGGWRVDLDQTGLGSLYRLYRTSDSWLAIACLQDDDWRRLATTVGREDLAVEPGLGADAPFGRPELGPVLEAVFATKTATEWFEVLDDAGVPCEIADDAFIDEWYDDPQIVENGMVTDYVHPVLGRVEQLGSLIAFSDTPEKISRPPVVPGFHTVEILAELGYDDDAIADLEQRGAVMAFPPDQLPSD